MERVTQPRVRSLTLFLGYASIFKFMIDTSIHQFKLELLRQYIFAKIDGHLPKIGASKMGSVVMVLNTMPVAFMSPDDIIRLYAQTGIMFWSSNKEHEREVTFEEYCEYKLHEPINLW